MRNKWGLTRSKVKRLRLDHPDYTLEKIGQIVGRKRWIVYWHLRRLNLPTRAILRSKDKRFKPCLACFRSSTTRICSPECYKRYNFFTFVCPICGKNKVISRKLLKMKLKMRFRNVFCSTKCFLSARVFGGLPSDSLQKYQGMI